MSVTYSDRRVLDAMQRWFRLPKRVHWHPIPGGKFIVSPEGDAGVLVEIREDRRFVCVENRPYQGTPSVLSRVQPRSTLPDAAVVIDAVRYPLRYFGDDRIIGALEDPSWVLLLVNLGMEVALVVVTYSDPPGFWVVWSGAGNQMPELDDKLRPVTAHKTPPPSTPPDPPAAASAAAPLSVRDTNPHDSDAATPRSKSATPEAPPPAAGQRDTPPLADPFPPEAPFDPTPSSASTATPGATPPSSAATSASTSSVTANSGVGQPPEGPRAPGPSPSRNSATTAAPAESSSPPLGTPSSASPCPPAPPRASPLLTTPTVNAAAVSADAAITVLSPRPLSEEVTAILVRHLRHAATLLPIAKGAEVARQWLIAFECACGDMRGIGDVVGGSAVLFTALHAGGHLAVMPSTVSSSAAARLLVMATPLVERVSKRRWALRVSALLDTQSAIFRKLARRAPETCRLAATAPPVPAPATRVRKANTGSAAAATRRPRTVELAAQLAAAKAEIDRLRADVAALRRHTVPSDGEPAAAVPTGTTGRQDPVA